MPWKGPFLRCVMNGVMNELKKGFSKGGEIATIIHKRTQN